MNLIKSFKLWQFRRKPDNGFPLVIKRYDASLLDENFMAALRFMRNSDDWIKFDLLTMPGFKWREEVAEWMEVRNCQYKVNLELRPQLSEQKNDRMVITFLEEQDAMEFKLTFL